MTDQEVKLKILEIFELERKNPTADFEESHFMDYLTFPAHSENTIKNTFRGVRKYYQFMNKLELEFGICFTLSDLHRYYSVDQLTKKVIERVKKGRGNKMILKQRNDERRNYLFELILILILIGIFYWQGINWISISLTIVVGIAIYWTLSSKIYNKKHNKRLTLKILDKA